VNQNTLKQTNKKHNIKKVSAAKLLLIIWTITVCLASILNFSKVPRELFVLPDKIMHMIIYIPLGSLFVLSFPRHSKLKLFIYAIIFAGAFGLLMELVQLALPWRDFDFLDEAFNIMGGCLGAALALLIKWP
jgi:VanZ family protein